MDEKLAKHPAQKKDARHSARAPGRHLGRPVARGGGKAGLLTGKTKSPIRSKWSRAKTLLQAAGAIEITGTMVAPVTTQDQ